MERYYTTVANYVKEYLQTTERPGMGKRRTASFRWRHTLRVLATARGIGKLEGADLEVLELGTLLHDIAKLDPRSDEVHHAVLGSKVAEKFLRTLEIPETKIAKIVEVVRYHSINTEGEDLSLETLVLKDSDRLDEVGALGVIQSGVHAGRVGMDYRGCFRQGIKDLGNLQNVKLYTATGKELFAKRLQVMEKFWRQAEHELSGETISPYSELD